MAGESERNGDPRSQASAQQLLNRILQQQPSNAAVLLESLRLAAKRGDMSEARRLFAAVRPSAASWPDVARQQLAAIERDLDAGNTKGAAVQVQFLRNILLRVPTYRASLDQVATPATLVAQPFTRFLRLPAPNSEPAAPDTQMRFEMQPVSEAGDAAVSWVDAIFLDDQSPATLAWGDGKALHLASGAALPLPGAPSAPLTKNSIAVADLNYDFKADISIATKSGFRVYLQQDAQHFRDVTLEAKIPPAIANASYTGVWAFDIDLDGDLDLILGVPHGEPVVLRNNGDGTFSPIHPFGGIDGLTDFVAADIDGDGEIGRASCRERV